MQLLRAKCFTYVSSNIVDGHKSSVIEKKPSRASSTQCSGIQISQWSSIIRIPSLGSQLYMMQNILSCDIRFIQRVKSLCKSIISVFFKSLYFVFSTYFHFLTRHKDVTSKNNYRVFLDSSQHKQA